MLHRYSSKNIKWSSHTCGSCDLSQIINNRGKSTSFYDEISSALYTWFTPKDKISIWFQICRSLLIRKPKSLKHLLPRISIKFLSQYKSVNKKKCSKQLQIFAKINSETNKKPLNHIRSTCSCEFPINILLCIRNILLCQSWQTWDRPTINVVIQLYSSFFSDRVCT